MPEVRGQADRLALVLATLALAACGENLDPTQPEASGDPATAPPVAAVSGSWAPRAPTPFGADIFGYDLGTTTEAGESIVYTFGGTSSEENLTGIRIQAYDVATDTWSGRLSEVGVFYSNGVGKIGSRLYFSGGYNEHVTLPFSSNALWAYDYTRDRMIRRADLPIFSAEGVTGVIDGKLYVLPGACNGNSWPNPGYCAVEHTRRFYRYDPATNTWVSRLRAPHYHRQGAAAVISGKFYVVGGLGEFGAPVSALDVYDPATNTWRTLAPIPTGGVASGAAIEGQLFVIVRNFNGTVPDDRAYAYNRATNQWKVRAAPDVSGAVTRVTLNGRPHLFTATGDRSALYTP